MVGVCRDSEEVEESRPDLIAISLVFSPVPPTFKSLQLREARSKHKTVS